MTDFSQPEYRSYADLVIAWFERDGSTDGSAADAWLRGHGRTLPTLADWLDMLAEAGYDRIEFSPYRHADFRWMARYAVYPITAEGHFEQNAGFTREEAAAKLWVHVTALKKGQRT